MVQLGGGRGAPPPLLAPPSAFSIDSILQPGPRCQAREQGRARCALPEDEEEEEEEEEGPAEEHPTKGSTDSGTKQADPHVRSQPGTHPGRGFSLGPPNGTAPRRFGWGGHTHTRRLHSPQQFEEARLRGRT